MKEATVCEKKGLSKMSGGSSRIEGDELRSLKENRCRMFKVNQMKRIEKKRVDEDQGITVEEEDREK